MLHYISPSVLPSRTANSVHVVQQCKAFADLGFNINLYVRRSKKCKGETLQAISSTYGKLPENLSIVSYYSKFNRGINILIALTSIPWVLNQNFASSYILSRNLYAAFILALIFRKNLVYETHILEFGFRKWLQKALIKSSKVTTILISQKLLECISEHHSITPQKYHCLHDAAPSGIEVVPKPYRRDKLSAELNMDFSHWSSICGYFGHLYHGRGIEVIIELAKKRPSVCFMVFGGNDSQILEFQKKVQLTNLMFMGYVPHLLATKFMKLVDILLMPYQESVSIDGSTNHDTARWMSPMKMFEYMASGVPIVSSDLPVLKEVLKHNQNCLLSRPTEIDDWVASIDKIESEPDFAESIGLAAHNDYKEKYTWSMRAKIILDAMGVSV